MHSDSPLLTLLVVGLGLAFVFGAIAVRFRLSPLVGYLFAGVVVGPFTPGFVADAGLAGQLAELGVILLMFGVGLHFSPKDLLSVRAVAAPAMLLQMLATIVAGVAFALAVGWTIESGVVLGLALSVASTVVALRSLQERRLMLTDRGRLAVGWLVVEDLAMVLALVLLPTWASIRGDLAEGEVTALKLQDIGLAVALTVGKVAAFALIMLLVGKRAVPWLLHRVVHMGSRELFRLAVLAIALGIAYFASTLFGISFALGALFAGLIMAESELSQQAANETLPLRDAFAVLFFVSVGMLFDPLTLIEHPWSMLATVIVILFFRTVVSIGLLRMFGQNWETSWTVAATRGQIGEFSFILAGLGVSLGLLPEQGQDLMLGGAIISILLNPVLFFLGDRLAPKPHPVVEPEKPAPPPSRAILVGYGRVGSLIGRALEEARATYAVIETRDDVVAELSERNIAAFAGNALSKELLKEAGVDKADLMFVTVPDGFEAGRVVEVAKKLNPNLRIFARAHSDAEVVHLKEFGADLIISGEREIADAMMAAASHIIPRRIATGVTEGAPLPSARPA